MLTLSRALQIDSNSHYFGYQCLRLHPHTHICTLTIDLNSIVVIVSTFAHTLTPHLQLYH